MDDKMIISEVVRTIEMESKSISDLLVTLDTEMITKVVKLIANCKGKIVLTGCGTSAMAGKKIAHTLSCIECPAFFLTPSDAVHGSLGSLQPVDILILISKGGNTAELIPIVKSCKQKGALSIAITENTESKLAKLSDFCLNVRVEREPCRFNMLATASTLAVISVFDAICIALMQYKGYTKEQFAIIHPAGAVGERLLGKDDE